ncbi:T9SS type A sorting domain-containing protein [Spirosoma sp. RP8]|uniref:T9SS type A sorting domain-containing protein n=1 Tax=Spirosoma liriopis TaxID=2937440 RepID=A0ABT0HIS9_9BACT|nr:T9SS type A sorting domain-containing protein [Spirosoma liriopis]MCK8492071.1 T9SS type A sorting domain-containing protein [Spirosoma liriopis]
MKGPIRYFYLFICFCLTGFMTPGKAQTITTGTLSASIACTGSNGTLVISFSTTGAFSTGNVFTAQLSDANGVFSGSTISIGTLSLVPSAANTATISATIPKTTAASVAYKIRVISSSPARISTNTQQVAVQSAPGLPTVSTPAAYCEGDVAQPLTATASSGGTLNWYGTNASNAPTSIATVPNTNLTSSTAYYVSQTLNGCVSDKVSIKVTVNERPDAPIVANKSYCQGSVASPLSATTVTKATLNWYTGATGGVASSIAPTPNTSVIGQKAYYVSQTLNGCESERVSLLVTTSNALPAPATIASVSICQGATTAALTATALSGATLRWWGTSATGGTASATPTVPTNQSSATYYVSQIIDNCESQRAAIAVTVLSAPASPSVPSSLTYCQHETAKPLSATALSGGTLNWYGTNRTGGTATSTPTTPGTTSASTTLYYVAQVVGNCESPRASLSVQVKPLPTTPTVVSPTIYCQNRPANALSATPAQGGTLNWYGTNATGGTASVTAPTPSTSTVSSTVYYVSQTLNGCESARTSLTALVNPLPNKPAGITPSPYCEGAKANPLSASGQDLHWYGTQQSGGPSSLTATIPNTSIIGTTNYYVTQIVNGCESDRAAIPVLVKDAPTAPVTTPVDFCQNSPVPTLPVTLTANATANWYGTNATGGTASATSPVVQNTTPGQTMYYVSQTLDGCQSTRASLVVTVKAIPVAPGVSSVNFCNNAQAQALTATGSNIKWYDASDQPLANAPTPGTNTIGNQLFKATQTVNGCESNKAALTVSIKPIPASPIVSNLTFCQAQKDQPAQTISPLTASGQNLRWYNTDGRVYSSAPTPPISQTGSISYQVTQTVDNCESQKATLQVYVQTTPVPVVSKPVVAYCVDEKSVPLEATAEPGGVLHWVDPYGHETTVAPAPPTINVNVEPGGDAYYVYQTSSSGCYSARSVVKVIVNAIPTLSLTGSASINLGERTPLRLQFTGNPPFSYTLTGGYSGVSRTTDTTIQVLPRGNTTYQVTTVSNSCGVGLPGNPATAVISVQSPTIATSSIGNNIVCAGTTLTVPFQTTGAFRNGNTFTIDLISTADTSKKYEISATSTNSPVTARLSDSFVAGQYYVRVKGSNPDVEVIGTNSPTLVTVRSKPIALLKGDQTIYAGVPASLTVTLSGENPWTVTYADSLRSYVATTTTNPYVAEVRPARTTTYHLVSVSNGCGAGAISGTATVKVLVVTGLENNSLDPLVGVYPVPAQTSVTVAIDMPLSRTPAVLSLMDQQGRTIHQLTTRTAKTELDLSTQPTGQYILRIQVGDRQSVRKILKQ